MAERIEYLENVARHYKGLSQRLHQQLMATRNTPETHRDRYDTRDPVGNLAAARADRQKRK
ncbi:hypothetical protein [Pseudarthrobacter sp. S9]|uniref:hypothetical protein n=1 Tax=Pseudarthrobacter sp. S9 TaxID=3418421 RepID=UPI003CFCECED